MPNEIAEVFSSNLSALLVLKGVSDHDFAEALSVSRSTVYYWRTGRTTPTVATLLRIAEYFQVPVGDLLEVNAFYF